ncbi:MAG: hypothetical protein AB8B63_19950 [Granulosicoccus sp.]
MSKNLARNEWAGLLSTASLSLLLVACGGSGSGGDGSGNTTGNANGLLDEAQGCAYLLDLGLTAEQLNEGGCAYTDENGQTQYWAGTNGTFGPESNPSVEVAQPATDTVADPVNDPATGPDSDSTAQLPIAPDSFPAVQPFGPELADNGTGRVYAGAVNSSLLSGPMVGRNVELTNDLYRSISYVTEGFPDGLEIVHALVYDNGSADDDAHLIMHMQNSTRDLQCFVSHGTLTAYDSSGSVVGSGLLDFSYVDGSLGITSSGIYTNTCIAPDEIVYFTNPFGIGESVALDEVAAVKVSNLTTRPASMQAEAVVKPLSYEMVGEAIEVLIANQSQESIDLFSSRIFVISDDGVPVYQDLTLPQVILQPGEEYRISHSARFKGTASTIRIVLDYEPAEESVDS